LLYEISPFELALDRLNAYPKRATTIQIERRIFENLLNEYEEIEAENIELREELGQ